MSVLRLGRPGIRRRAFFCFCCLAVFLGLRRWMIDCIGMRGCESGKGGKLEWGDGMAPRGIAIHPGES